MGPKVDLLPLEFFDSKNPYFGNCPKRVFKEIWGVLLTPKIVVNIFRSKKVIDLKICMHLDRVIPNMLKNFQLISTKGSSSTAYLIKNIG